MGGRILRPPPFRADSRWRSTGRPLRTPVGVLTGVTVFAVASAACGFSASIRQLVIARSIQGIGAALLVPGSLAIISASFDEGSRGKAIGTWSGLTAITTALGPVAGGWLIEHASWRWAFFVNLPLAAAVILISLRHMPETRDRKSTRLNSSHEWISYAVFCLKKKKINILSYIDLLDVKYF